MKAFSHRTGTTTSSSNSSKAFFGKEKAAAFFSQSNDTEQPFFRPQPVQPKLAVGQPMISYVKENGALPEKEVAQSKPSMQVPRQASLQEVSQQSSQAANQGQLTPLFAGAPARKNPPGGITYIVGRSGSSSLGSTAGLTLRKNAAAFTAPVFQTTNRHQRVNGRNQHFATVLPTQTADVIHESFYPGPGLHNYPMASQPATQQYQYFYRISRSLSNLIRLGEQEHLDDLQRAYELTYGLIARIINQMSGREFGPANTPYEADQLAARELARLLPAVLGNQPRNWPVMLDRLLNMTERRDREGWHSLSNGPPITRGRRVIYPLQQEPTFNVGQVPSSQVVNYPQGP